MAPKITPGELAKLTDTGLEALGLSPSFITDFDRFKELKNVVDFTKVDRDAAQNLLHTAGQVAAKKAFETAGDAVDKGFQVVAGVLGATGQWYGTAAALVGEEALDLAESYFENWMGWTGDEPEPEVGEWVLIDMGRRRMLDADAFNPVSAEEQELAHLHGRRLPSQAKAPLKHATHLGLLLRKGPDADGRYNVFDEETGETTHPRRQGLYLLSKDENAELNRNSQLVQMKALAFKYDQGFTNAVSGTRYASAGDRAYYDGRPQTVTKVNHTTGQVVVMDNESGHAYRTDFGDEKLDTENAYRNTSFQPISGGIGGFVTFGGYHQGEYVWYQQDKSRTVLAVVQVLQSGSAKIVLTNATSPIEAALSQLRHAETPYGKVWARFSEAVVSNDVDRMEQHSPWVDHAEACVETWAAPERLPTSQTTGRRHADPRPGVGPTPGPYGVGWGARHGVLGRYERRPECRPGRAGGREQLVSPHRRRGPRGVRYDPVIMGANK